MSPKADSFDRIGTTLDRYANGRVREVLTVGGVGTFAAGWLLKRLRDSARTCPHLDLRLMKKTIESIWRPKGSISRFGSAMVHGTAFMPDR